MNNPTHASVGSTTVPRPMAPTSYPPAPSTSSPRSPIVSNWGAGRRNISSPVYGGSSPSRSPGLVRFLCQRPEENANCLSAAQAIRNTLVTTTRTKSTSNSRPAVKGLGLASL